jgi:hypothetical protein
MPEPSPDLPDWDAHFDAYWLALAGDHHDGVVVTETGRGRERYEFNAAEPVASRDHGMLGFSGRRWIVRFTDGRTVETNNLWHQGPVPEKFWPRFPVNAVLDQPPVKPFRLAGGS